MSVSVQLYTPRRHWSSHVFSGFCSAVLAFLLLTSSSQDSLFLTIVTFYHSLS